MGTARLTRWLRMGAVACAASLAILLPVEALGLSFGQQAEASASVSGVSPLGIYAGAANPGVISALGQTLGRQPTFAMDFLQADSWQSIEDPSWFLSQWKNSGYSMIWGVPILPNGTGYSLAAGASGAYNLYFVTLAKAFVAGGQGSSIIRLGWEFNGGWFPWAANGHAAAFVAYWQQIVTAMRSVPGANFTFEWNPTLGDMGVGNLANYYPGNAFVDYIGADVYDQSWATYPGASIEFSTIENQTYGLNWLSSFAAQQGKPITLPEWGLGSGPGNGGAPIAAANEEVAGGDDPVFINDMASWIASHNVYEATFYDVGQSAVNTATDPKSFAALVSDFEQGSTVTTTAPTSPAPPVTTTTTPTAAGSLPLPAAATPVKPYLAVWRADFLKALRSLKKSGHHLSSIHLTATKSATHLR
jgi:Glycosyl hydrolase family 26